MPDILGFFKSANSLPGNAALECDGKVYSYGELHQIVASMFFKIDEHSKKVNAFIGLLCNRSVTAYAGIIAVLAAGKAYVPLNIKYPKNRTAQIIKLAQPELVIVGNECVSYLNEIIEEIDPGIKFIISEPARSELQKKYSRYTFITPDNNRSDVFSPVECPDEYFAYLIFTSGSTGIPKGVGVTRKNLKGYITNQIIRYDIDEHDRFSQTADLSFDLSIHDLALTWQRGSCLCVVPEKYLFVPGKFILEQKITSWCSVPSVGLFMEKLRMLQPGMYPMLRYIVFCGEPLPRNITEKWQDAAPNARIDNLYGPTEATCAITYYVWDRLNSPSECKNGIVPIGVPFSNQKIVLCIPGTTQRISTGEGELYLAGSQVTTGYLNDTEKSKEHYMHLPDSSELWYRTGDLVTMNERQQLLYISRIDNLVKIHGYRIELQEIEHAIQSMPECLQAVAVAWPVKNGIAGQIVGIIVGRQKESNVEAVITHCKKSLPEYMVPARVHFIQSIPVNSNGKVDRKKIVEMLEKGEFK